MITRVCTFGAMILFAFGTVRADDLILTGVMDGTLPGGEPKAVELYALTDIADLSTYAISRAGNGSSTFDTITSDFILPSISLSAGDYYFAVGNSFTDQTDTFDTVFPEFSGQRSLNFGVNSNGDDVTGLFFDATGAFSGGESLVDVFGELGVDGSGTAWEHTDSWVYRNDFTGPSSTFVLSEWTIPGPDALDNLSAAEINAAVPFGTYTGVPEPTGALVLGLGCCFALIRRKQS